MTRRGRPLVDGEVEGRLLLLAAPLSFWGGLEPGGRISDPKHPDHGAIVTGKILGVPRIVGSSSSSQLLLELIYQRTHPAAILLGEADAIIAMAALVAREMGFGAIPILHVPLGGLRTGMRLRLLAGGRLRELVATPR